MVDTEGNKNNATMSSSDKISDNGDNGDNVVIRSKRRIKDESSSDSDDDKISSIKGTVNYKNMPVKNARINISGYGTVTSDDFGKFEFNKLVNTPVKGKNLVITFSHQDHQTKILNRNFYGGMINLNFE